MKRLTIIIGAMLLAAGVHAQGMKDPSSWRVSLVAQKGGYDVVFHTDLNPGWHIWSTHPGGDGTLIAPTFSIDQGPVTPVGPVREKGSVTEEVMEGIDGKVRYMKGQADFIQTVKAKSGETVKGSYTYQLCSESMCLPPKTATFSLLIP